MSGQPQHHLVYSQTRYVAFDSVNRNRVHRHSFYEPCIVISGNGEFQHETRVFELQQGDLFMADPGVFHEIRSLESRNLKLYFLTFNITKVSDPLRSKRQRPVLFNLADFLLHHQVYRPGQSHLIPLFEHAMKLVRRNTNYHKDPFYHDTSRLLVHQIVTALTDPVVVSKDNYSDHVQKNRVLELIEDGLHQPLRISELARRCGMSERNLRRKWTTWSKRSLTDEINHRRVERACHLLLLPDISIADVGYQVGIADPARFSRLFKQLKRMTPRNYRQRSLEKTSAAVSGLLPYQTEFLDGKMTEHRD